MIIVDPFDERADEEPASAILGVIGKLVLQIPKVRLLLTARPESRIWGCSRLPLLANATDIFVLRKRAESSDLVGRMESRQIRA